MRVNLFTKWLNYSVENSFELKSSPDNLNIRNNCSSLDENSIKISYEIY